MDVDGWWPRLARPTQQWLIDHNGEAVPDDATDAVADAGGPGRDDPSWESDEDSGGRRFPDRVVDRIEELANEEN